MFYLVRQSVKPVYRRGTFRAKSGLYTHVDPHMNELPVPCEPWKTWYDRRQAGLNKTLAIGIIWFAISFYSAVHMGTFDSRFFCAPENPAPKTGSNETSSEGSSNDSSKGSSKDPCDKK